MPFPDFARWAETQDPREINWDMVAEEFPEYDAGEFRNYLLEKLGWSGAKGARRISKEEFDLLNAPERIDIQPTEAEKKKESMKIAAVAGLAGIAEPATLAFPARREAPVREAVLRRGVPKEGAIGAATAEAIPPTPEEIADIQRQLEENRKTGNQRLEDFLSYIPKKFAKFGTEQYESLGLLGQLATQPEVEVEGQKIPTHQVVANLPGAVGEHFRGYIRDFPFGFIDKVKEDPFTALLDAYIVSGITKQVAKGLSGAAARAALKRGARKPGIKGEIPVMRTKREMELAGRKLTPEEYYTLESTTGAERLREQLLSTEEISNIVVKSLGKLQSYESIPISMRKGLTKATWENMSADARLEFFGMPKELSQISKGVPKPEVKVAPGITEKTRVGTLDLPKAKAAGKVSPAELPEGWKTDVQPNWRRKPGWKSEVDWKDKRIVFENEKLAKDPAVLNHEIAHILAEDKIGYIKNIPDSPLLREYAEIVKESNIHPNFVRERLAMDFGDYLTNSAKTSPALRALFERHFQKPTPKLAGRPEIIYNPEIERILSPTRGGEVGGAIALTSEELTQAGLQLEKLNLYTNYVGTPLWKALERGWEKYIPERIQRFFGENYGQPAQYVMAAEKNMTDMGLNIQKTNRLAAEAQKALTVDDKISVLKFVTDPERIGIRMKTPMGTKWEPVAMQIQGDMINLGGQAKNLGLIGEESFDFFFGRYLPKIHPEKGLVSIFPSKKMKFSARLKQRGAIKEIPIEELGKWEAQGYELFTDLGTGKARIRKFVPYGTEEDPLVLWAKGVSDLEHDIAIAKTIKFVADNKNWVSDIPKEGFVKLVKKGKALEDRFLRVSGIGNKYVHQEIAADLREMILTKSDWRKFFDQMTSLWKIGKTAYNPATHSRNIVSNSVLADAGGLSAIRRFDIYLEAAKQVVNKGKYFNEAKIGGLFGKEFQFEIESGLRSAASAKNAASFWSKMVKAYSRGPAARLYQGEEQFFKLAKFIHNRQKGMPVAEAVKDAHKWVFDYSTVSPFVALGRRTFFPFITFQAKALPRMFETAIKHPLRIAKYWAAYEAYNRHSKTRLGLSDEQYREIRQNTPDYIRRGGMWLLLPERDQNGNYQFVNMTYFMPWGDIISGGSTGVETGLFKGLPEPLQNILVPSHPIIRLPFELVLNRSIFYDRDIWRADENPWIEGPKYAAETLGPSIATQHAPRLYGRLIQKKPSYFGERETAGTTLMGLAGARPVSVNIERSAFFKSLEVERKIKDLESRYFSVGNDQSITNEQERKEKLAGIRAKIDKLIIEWKRISKVARRYESK